MAILSYSHKVLPGQTLSQIAAIYGITPEQIGWDNNIVAEIAEDNDLTGAALIISLPSTEDVLNAFYQGYGGLTAPIYNNEGYVQNNLDQLFSYLLFRIEEVFHRLLRKEAEDYPNAVLDLQSAHDAWLTFWINDDNWGMSMCYNDQHNRHAGQSDYDETQVRLKRADLMRARFEQLHYNEAEFDSRMAG